MSDRESLPGADENNFAARLKFCQIDIVGLDDDLSGGRRGKNARAIKTESNRDGQRGNCGF